MRVLVTGGAGFIGSHIVDALIEHGHEVSIVDDLSTGRNDNLNPNAKFYNVSITDVEGLKKVFDEARPQIVNHHAAQTSVRLSMSDPTYDASVNILGSINVLHNCAEYDVERLLFSSTCAVYAPPEYIPMKEEHTVRPESVYGASKFSVENYIRLYSDTNGMKYKIFRYGNVFGPRQNPGGEAGVVAIFTMQFHDGIQPTIFGDGNKTRDYVYVGDIVKANIKGMESVGDNDLYNLAGGKEVTDFQIFDAVRQASGSSVEPKYAPVRPGEAERVSLDYSKAQQVLGWSPTVHLQDGIQQVVKHFLQNRQSVA